VPETTVPAVELPEELRCQLAAEVEEMTGGQTPESVVIVNAAWSLVADVARRAYEQGHHAGAKDAAEVIADALKARGRQLNEDGNVIFDRYSERRQEITDAARAYARELSREGSTWLDAAELAAKCQLSDSSTTPASAVCTMTSDPASTES
jgi:ribose 1,5-bisphosphokinase PhnN